MQYIYSRVSTEDQKTEGQLVRLRQLYPDAQVVEETGSGVKERPRLNLLLSRMTKGDTLIVAALDRLGRQMVQALGLIEDMHRRGIALISLREGLDMTTTTGRFVMIVMLGFAEMERNLISERTKAGLAAARARGVHLGRKKGTPSKPSQLVGRKPKYKPGALDRITHLRKRGMSIAEIGKLTGVSVGKVHKVLKQHDLTCKLAACSVNVDSTASQVGNAKGDADRANT